MKSSTETIIAAMRILAADIQSPDGVANLAIAEAADRLEELQSALQTLLDAARDVYDFRDGVAIHDAISKAEELLTRGKS